MAFISWSAVGVGDELPNLVSTTDLANWNRSAAVNDEFIPIHGDAEAAREMGMPGVIGMRNQRISYLHNVVSRFVNVIERETKREPMVLFESECASPNRAESLFASVRRRPSTTDTTTGRVTGPNGGISCSSE